MKAAIVGIAGPDLTAAEAALLRAQPPAGVILFARNIVDPPGLAALVAALRRVLPTEAVLMVDQEGGRVARLRPPHWRAHPPAAALGALFALAPARGLRAAWLTGALIGLDCAAAGFDVVAAPVLDLRLPETHVAIGDRALAEDPAVVGRLGHAVAAGLLAAGIQPVGKHAPGHGRARVDSHLALPTVAANDLDADLLPFALNADLPWVMTAHILYPAWDPNLPATLSPAIIERVIRGRIGFEGVLVTDDLAMRALAGYAPVGDAPAGVPAALALQALAAGCDLAMYCGGEAAPTAELLACCPLVTQDGAARLGRARALARQRRRSLDVAALAGERTRLLAMRERTGDDSAGDYGAGGDPVGHNRAADDRARSEAPEREPWAIVRKWDRDQRPAECEPRPAADEAQRAAASADATEANAGSDGPSQGEIPALADGAPAAVPRVPFASDFPDVVIQRPYGSPVRHIDHPDYATAKAGDPEAATRFVDAMIDHAKLAALRDVIGRGKPTVVAVHAEEAAGRNAIPQTYAEKLSEEFGSPLDDAIIQANKPQRTGQNAEYRISVHSKFDGPIEPGRDYLIVDDNVTQGGTLADLRSFIESRGGRVVAASTLTGSRQSEMLAPRAETIAALRARFPSLESRWQGTFGHDFSGLTESEANYLLRSKGSDSRGDRVITRAQEGTNAANPRNPRAPGRGEEGYDGDDDGEQFGEDQGGGGVTPPPGDTATGTGGGTPPDATGVGGESAGRDGAGRDPA